MKSARGLSRRQRSLAAFGWCRNDTGEPQRVGTPIFEEMTPVKCALQIYLDIQKNTDLPLLVVGHR